MILHIPHSSRRLLGFIEMKNEQDNLDYLTDDFTDDIFDYDGASSIVKFSLSRFICDIERLENDPLVNEGHGIIYTKDCFGNDIVRYISDEIVYQMYRQHHDKFTKAVNSSLTILKNVVIVDCHSFPDPDHKYSDICIGRDMFHTTDDMIDIVKEVYTAEGYSVSINEPYSGTFIPKQHININSNVKSILIDINKIIFIDYDKIKSTTQRALDILDEYEWKIA